MSSSHGYRINPSLLRVHSYHRGLIHKVYTLDLKSLTLNINMCIYLFIHLCVYVYVYENWGKWGCKKIKLKKILL